MKIMKMYLQFIFAIQFIRIKCFFLGLLDESVVVRNAALFTLGQYSEHVQVSIKITLQPYKEGEELQIITYCNVWTIMVR